ncbi:hypothetical protein [Prochlorococcus sp. MIT 1223]|uniref:hypothetical protein n=1 Tax=Prochlorococcus sp. MIT 1223 TaxID=3096217 RepID=UPI002A764AF0|nr:hypothetical protein [Prochlorococcus sp. MIT 1223]
MASSISHLNTQERDKSEIIVYAHLFGVIGDWYICEISNDGKTAFGYRNIAAEKEWEMAKWIENYEGWGEFSIESLQKLVNEEFLKEQDIRFLIVRDIYWEKRKFSEVDTEESTLNYPGSDY